MCERAFSSQKTLTLTSTLTSSLSLSLSCRHTHTRTHAHTHTHMHAHIHTHTYTHTHIHTATHSHCSSSLYGGLIISIYVQHRRKLIDRLSCLVFDVRHCRVSARFRSDCRLFDREEIEIARTPGGLNRLNEKVGGF